MPKAAEPNPFASPTSPPADDVHRRRPDYLWDARRRAMICTFFLVLTAAIDASYVGSRWQNYLAIVQGASEDEIYRLHRECGVRLLASLCALFASAVAVLMWTYSSHVSIERLNGRKLPITPHGAVLWYFVPLFNLVKPYQAMVQLWQSSKPESVDAHRDDWRSVSPPPLLWIWWGTWWTCRIIGFVWRYPDPLWRNRLSPLDYALLDSVSPVLEILAAGLLVTIVWGVERRQRARYRWVMANLSAILGTDKDSMPNGTRRT